MKLNEIQALKAMLDMNVFSAPSMKNGLPSPYFPYGLSAAIRPTRQLSRSQSMDVHRDKTLQDEIKNLHDMYEKRTNEYNQLKEENRRLRLENKSYKEQKLATVARINNELKRPLTPDDFEHPYSVDATTQLLLSLRKLLEP